MPGLPDLSRRRLVPELMDQPGLDPVEHRRALEALARVNWISRVAGSFWRFIAPLAREAERPLRILDLACGGGDVALSLRRLADRGRVAIEVEGCDLSRVAIEHATESARECGLDARFFCSDLMEELPCNYDVFCSSLFLHHLEVDEAERLLGRLATSGAQLVLLSDLVRSKLGYALAHVGPRLLSLSHVAWHDGPSSVGAAFTAEEILGLASRVGVPSPRVSRAWPQRFLLHWHSL